ncbi:unnamed protein product [Boreogadus saida]
MCPKQPRPSHDGWRGRRESSYPSLPPCRLKAHAPGDTGGASGLKTPYPLHRSPGEGVLDGPGGHQGT